MKKFFTSTSEDLFLEVIILYRRQPLITYNIITFFQLSMTRIGSKIMLV